MSAPYFTRATFAFLRDLAANNDREWFKQNRDRYIDDVQEPALAFIVDFAPKLEKISPYFRADAKVVGGSLFRIQRDTRFSKDKTPYKENTGVQFRHQAAKDAHAPGFYLHLQPGECFAGVGLWRPETKVAYQIREAIAADPAGWKRATRSTRFTSEYALGGDSLIRPPKGFDPDDPLIEDLKRKDFIASTALTQRAITALSFLDDYAALCRDAKPFMAYLCKAVGVPF